MHFGEHVRIARKRMGLTSQGLAERAGVSRTLVSQIESGRANPSVESLERVARALNLPMGELFDGTTAAAAPAHTRSPGPSSGAAGIVRRDQRVIMEWPGRRARVELLVPNFKGSLQATLVAAEPSGPREWELDAHDGDEWIMVLEGRGEVAYGDERFILEAGDCMRFPDCTVVHDVRLLGDEPGKLITVITPPVM